MLLVKGNLNYLEGTWLLFHSSLVITHSKSAVHGSSLPEPGQGFLEDGEGKGSWSWGGGEQVTRPWTSFLLSLIIKRMGRT